MDFRSNYSEFVWVRSNLKVGDDSTTDTYLCELSWQIQVQWNICMSMMFRLNKCLVLNLSSEIDLNILKILCIQVSIKDLGFMSWPWFLEVMFKFLRQGQSGQKRSSVFNWLCRLCLSCNSLTFLLSNIKMT